MEGKQEQKSKNNHVKIPNCGPCRDAFPSPHNSVGRQESWQGSKGTASVSPPRRPLAEAGKEAEPTLLLTLFLGLGWRSASSYAILPPRWETPGPWRTGGRFLFQQPRLHLRDHLSVRPWGENPGILKGKIKKQQCKTSGWVLITRHYPLASQGLHTGQPLSPELP